MRPFGIVTTPSGGVRLFYEKVHHQGTLVSGCPNPPTCYWSTQIDTSTGELMVAWVEPNQMVGKAVVADKWNAYNATMILDTIGRIHIAAYTKEPSSTMGYPTVRYLQLGP